MHIYFHNTGGSRDDNTSQLGGAFQLDAYLSQNNVAYNDDIPYQQEGASPNPIVIISDQEG